jgi:alpha-beta hydrolase superfamily lysophospholipase
MPEMGDPMTEEETKNFMSNSTYFGLLLNASVSIHMRVKRRTIMSVFKDATVVVVHGVWAEGSSWETVIRELQKQGLNVVAAPIPLTSLSDDAAALRRTIARTEGPVILAGHGSSQMFLGKFWLQFQRPSLLLGDH